MAVVKIDLEITDKGASQVVRHLSDEMKALGTATDAWSAKQQRSAMAMSAMREAAAELNKELEKQKQSDAIQASNAKLDAHHALLGTVAAGFAAVAAAGVAAFVAIGAAIATVVAGFVNFAGRLSDLSATTGISTEALQKLAFAGSLVGVSQDEIAASTMKMQKALANGDAVFGKLGLSVEKLKAMKPDEAFAAIAAQIARIKDPAAQAAAAMEAFGKGGGAIMALLKSDIKGAGEEAEKLGTIIGGKDVQAADALGDAGTKLGAAWEGVKNQFAAAILQNPAVLQGLERLVAAMGELAQWVVANRGAIAALAEILIGAATTGFKTLATWAGEAWTKLRLIIDLIPGLRQALDVAKQFGTYLSLKNTQAQSHHSSSATISDDPGITFDAGKGKAAAAKQELAEIDKAMQSYKASYVALENEISAFVSRTNKLAVAEDKKFWAEKLKGADDYGKNLLKSITAYQAEQDRVTKENADVFAEMYARAADQVYGIFADLGDRIGGAWGGMFKDLGGMLANFTAQNKNGLGDFMAKHKETINSIALGLTTAYEIGSDAYAGGKASKSPGKGALMGAGKGALKGAAIGSVLPGVGTAAGAVIGGVIGGVSGYLGGKKGQADELKALTAEFTALKAQADKAGVALRASLNPKNAKEMKAAIDEVKRALDINADAQEKLNAAIGRYGFTVDELGPVMARQELDKQAMQLYQDWQLLNAAGVEHGAILERVGPSVGTLVDNYVKAGVEIPSALKPINDELFQSGQLLHENGEAYSQAEYEGLSYAQTMSEMFRELIASVAALVSALNGIPNTSSTHTIHTVRDGDPGDPVDPNGPVDYGGGRGGGPTRYGDNSASGYLNPSMSSDQWLKAHRGERVEITPAANSAARNASGRGGKVVNVTVNVAGDGDAQKIRDIVQRALSGGYIKVPA